jgi:hypothetical protein
MWADRIVSSAIARQITESGLASQTKLHEVSDAWTKWATEDDGWFSILHGEIICRVK